MDDTQALLAPIPLDPATAASTRRAAVIWLSILAGVALSVLWSAKLVDDTIGFNVAHGVLGHDAVDTGIVSNISGIAFAFATGLAGTFTACNVACFSAIAPMIEGGTSRFARARNSLRPLGWLSVGLVVVSAVYGAIGGVLGDRLPQLSTDTIGNGFPVRLIQSMVVFGVLGIAMLWMGLAAVGSAPDPLGRLTARWPQTPMVVMGAITGGFLIGRPYPLFKKMFMYAADQHNALYGALTFTLVAIGNVLVMAILFLVLSMGGGFQRWLQATPTRLATFTGSALLIGGAFTFVYWVVRLPSHFGYGWFPTMPWH